MAAPFAAVPVQAQQAQAQAKPQELDLQKQVDSKFDGVMANKAHRPDAAINGPQGLQQIQIVQGSQHAEKGRLHKVGGADAGGTGQDLGSSLSKSLTKVESDWNSAE